MFRTVLLLLAGLAVGAPLTLVRDGEPASTIVIAEQPTRTAQFAALELQEHVQQMTGAVLPIVRGAAPAGTVIYVGPSAAALPAAPTGDQEYLVAYRPNALILLGVDDPDTGEVQAWQDSPFAFRTWPGFFTPHNTLNAVYDFLERDCGVRWFRPGELARFCPSAKTLTVDGKDRTRAPAFKYREPSHYFGNSEAYDGSAWLWNTQMYPQRHRDLAAAAYPELAPHQANGWHRTHAYRGIIRLWLLRQRAGGEAYACNHSLYGYYDRFLERNSKDPKAAELFERPEPDWFAKGYDGRPPQMCYTNEALANQVVADARTYFAGKGVPSRAQARGDYFAFCPMDNSSYCKCAACQKWFNAADQDNKQFSNGRWSDYVFQFGNRIAAGVGPDHPDKTISMLAYAAYAYPPSFKLEPNISVGFCLHTRNIWGQSIQANDLALFNRWMEQEPGRRYFLFLYYCFPQENAGNGTWHCFPGFFAHGVADWFKRFNDNGVRGAYFCGWGQDVEAYVTFKLMDDPAADVDRLLDDYFTHMYGPAAAPMKTLYLEIEKAYSTPGNYPEDFHGHQKEFVAWGSLGTAERMAQFAELMAQARQLTADSPADAARVALFEHGIWEYMVAGRSRYVIREWRTNDRPPATQGIVPARVGDAVPLVVTEWRNEAAEAVDDGAVARLAHDGETLYLDLEDQAARGDDPGWDFVFALRSERPFQRLRIGLDGSVVSSNPGQSKKRYVVPATAAAETTGDGRVLVRVAIPLATLLDGGVEPGWTLAADIVRRRPTGNLHWSANVAGAEEPRWFGHLTLAAAGLPPGEPNGVPALPEGTNVKEIAPGVTSRVVDIRDLCQANDDLIQGISFTCEPKAVYLSSRGTIRPTTWPTLTDARTARAPTDDFFLSGKGDIAMEFALPEPRRLAELRLFWSLGDPARGVVRCKFAVRPAGSDEWRDLTDWLDVPRATASGNTFGVLAVDCRDRGVGPVDAIRLIDGMGSYNTRLVELDAFAVPEEPGDDQ